MAEHHHDDGVVSYTEATNAGAFSAMVVAVVRHKTKEKCVCSTELHFFTKVD
jgi:hypothetical protein